MSDQPRELPAADVIRVERHGDQLTITVDGKPLGVPFAPDEIQSVIGPGLHPGINLTLLARRVDIVNDLDERHSPEAKAALRSRLDALSPPGTPAA